MELSWLLGLALANAAIGIGIIAGVLTMFVYHEVWLMLHCVIEK